MVDSQIVDRTSRGLITYYHHFVKDYGKMAWPLIERLHKENFFWDEEVEQAFRRLKTAMTSLPVLALLDFSRPFIVETDASSFGLGVVLMQG